MNEILTIIDTNKMESLTFFPSFQNLKIIIFYLRLEVYPPFTLKTGKENHQNKKLK